MGATETIKLTKSQTSAIRRLVRRGAAAVIVNGSHNRRERQAFDGLVRKGLATLESSDTECETRRHGKTRYHVTTVYRPTPAGLALATTL